MALVALPTAATAVGPTIYWDGDPGAVWGTAANWSTNTVPTGDDWIQFDTGTTSVNDLGANTPIRDWLVLNSAGLALSGDSLLLDTGSISIDQDARIENNIFGSPGRIITDNGVQVQITGTITVNSGEFRFETGFDPDSLIAVDNAVTGPGEILKTGWGTLFLSSGGGFSGPIEAYQGAVIIGGDMSTANFDFHGDVLAGGLPILAGGTGSLVGDISLTHAVLSPGLSKGSGGLGSMEGTASLIAVDSTLLSDIDGTNHDLVTIADTANLGDMKLDVNLITAPAVGYAWDILDAGTVAGEFTTPEGLALPDDTTFVDDDQRYRIDYGSTFVALTYLGPVPAPEPVLAASGLNLSGPLVAVGALLTLGAAALTLSRRRLAR
jgi:hypothetical protein